MLTLRLLIYNYSVILCIIIYVQSIIITYSAQACPKHATLVIVFITLQQHSVKCSATNVLIH